MASEYKEKVLPVLPLPELTQRIVDAGMTLYGHLTNIDFIEQFAKALSNYGGKVDNTWASYGYCYVKAMQSALTYVVPKDVLEPANEWQGETVVLKREYKKPYKKWLLKYWFGDPSMENQAEACMEKLPALLAIKNVEPYMAAEECLMAHFDETKYPYPIPISFLEKVHVYRR